MQHYGVTLVSPYHSDHEFDSDHEFISQKPWVEGVGMHHGVTFNFGPAKVCSPAIFETCELLELFRICILHNCTICVDIFTPIKKFYSFIIFSLFIYAVILLLNCLVLVLYLYIHFLYVRRYFL